jgi:hypothetical protein
MKSAPAFRIISGQWVAVDHPRLSMPISRLAALRGVEPSIAEHPEWIWEADHWQICWPTLGIRLSERRLRALMTRWMLIQMSMRRAKRGQGSQIDTRERTGIMPSTWLPVLQNGPTPFAVCGGMAVNYYARPRQTEDVDIMVLTQDAETWDAFFRDHGWARQGALSIGGWTYTNGELEIDVLFSHQDWAARAIAEAQENLHDGLPIMPLAWLVWMKLDAGRTIDQTDVSRMLGRLTPDEFRKILETLSPWLAIEDREDLDSLYQLGRWEMHAED